MNYQAWIDPRVRKLSVAQVRRYLEGHGWNLVPFPRPELLVFEHPRLATDPVRLTLPASEALGDYQMRLVELLGSLGICESRYAGDILTEMLSGPVSNGALPTATTTSSETANK